MGHCDVFYLDYWGWGGMEVEVFCDDVGRGVGLPGGLFPGPNHGTVKQLHWYVSFCAGLLRSNCRIIFLPQARLCRGTPLKDSVQHKHPSRQTTQSAPNAIYTAHWPPDSMQLHTPNNYMQPWLRPPHPWNHFPGHVRAFMRQPG